MRKYQNEKKKVCTRILVVDDHPLMRQAVSQLINRDKRLEVCGEADNPHDALIAIEELKPDMTIVDLYLKKGSSGIELIKDIKARYPHILILVLSMLDESLYAERALRAGAKGYIRKEETASKVVTAIHHILNGQIYLSDNLSSKLINRFFDGQMCESESIADLLTDRELEVFRLLGQGFGTNQIAKNLHVSMKTIETYRSHIKDKLKLEDFNKLIQYAVQWVFTENKYGV
ncbi:MAG: response regulator transcription factor [bacterium]